MAEWIEIENGYITLIAGDDLRVQTGFGPWSGFGNDEPQAEYKDVWSLHFAPVTRLQYRPLKATDAEQAKLEALHIVGEWAKSLAVQAGELRGRMAGAAMNASYYTDWINEDELPEGYPYNLAFGRSVVIDGVRMFPPVNQQAASTEDES